MAMASDVVIDQNLKIPLLAHSNKLLKYASNDKDRKARFSDVALLSGKKVSYCFTKKRWVTYIGSCMIDQLNFSSKLKLLTKLFSRLCFIQ